MSIFVFNCKECEKPIEVNTMLSDKNLRVNSKDLPYADGLMIHGSVTVCSGCKTPHRIKFNQETCTCDIIKD